MRYRLLLIGVLFTFSAVAQVRLGGSDGGIFIAGDGAGSFPSVPVEGPPVLDAPYSGEVVNVFTQTLSDGNRIHREDRALFYRDRQGRTRREETVNGRKVIRISDPTANLHYILDPEKRTGQVLPLSRGELRRGFPEGVSNQIGMRIQIPAALGRAAMRGELPEDASETTEENLGSRVLEGVNVIGTLSTTILPAEAFHAERDIEITFERWRSEELQLDIERIRKDPRNGDTTYRLTNLNLSEPLASLFEPPADYQIDDVTRMRGVFGNAP